MLGYLKFDPMNTFMTRQQNSLVANWPAARSQGSINKPPAVEKRCSSSMNSVGKVCALIQYTSRFSEQVMVPVVYVIKHLTAIFKYNFSREILSKSYVYLFVTCVLNFPIFSNCGILLLYFRFSKKGLWRGT